MTFLAPLSVPGYEPGRLPARRKVEEPTLTELVKIPPEKQVEYAWTAISSTQGRRTSVPGMARRMVKALGRDGYQVEYVDKWTSRPALAAATWSMQINDSGVSPRYSPVSQAAGIILIKLHKQLLEGSVLKDRKLELEHRTVSDFSRRRVGWETRIVLSDTAPQPSLEGSHDDPA